MLKSVITIVSILIVGFSALTAGAGEAYVCPPCGHEQDAKAYDEPGKCPVCGMELVKKNDLMNVAILIFDGVQIIDYTGPYEVFGQAGRFNVFTVSESGKTITTTMGMSVNPAYSFESSPRPDVLVVPGGHVRDMYESPAVLDWIRTKSAEAQYVLSVCNGAFILAKSGLLDGLSATTFYRLIDDLEEFAPDVNVVSDKRFVDNGKIITSAGLSSGIDAALHVISRIRGMGRARSVALNLEYDWRPDSDYARAALADRQLPDLDPPLDSQIEVLSTQGDREHWEVRYGITSPLTVDELERHLSSELARQPAWKKAGKGRWTRLDDEGRLWDYKAVVEAEGATPGRAVVTLTLDRQARKASAP